MDWIDLLQDRDRRRAFVNAIMKLRVWQNAGNFLTSWGLCAMNDYLVILHILRENEVTAVCLYEYSHRLSNWTVYSLNDKRGGIYHLIPTVTSKPPVLTRCHCQTTSPHTLVTAKLPVLTHWSLPNYQPSHAGHFQTTSPHTLVTAKLPALTHWSLLNYQSSHAVTSKLPVLTHWSLPNYRPSHTGHF